MFKDSDTFLPADLEDPLEGMSSQRPNGPQAAGKGHAGRPGGSLLGGLLGGGLSGVSGRR